MKESDSYQCYQCERCKINKAEYVCSICKPINSFCSKCDSHVHTLPSKKQHRREYLKESLNNNTNCHHINKDDNDFWDLKKDKIKIQDQNEKMDTNIPCNNSLLFSSITSNPNFNPNTYNDNNKNIRAHNLSYIEENKFSSSGYYNGTKVYTREYVNEIKNIYEIEKQELIYKNSSLQNNLDRLKTSFGDQIQDLQKLLEENNLKNNHQIRLILGEHKIILQTIANEKDGEIDNLNKQVEEFKKCNEELLDTLRQNIKQTKETKSRTKHSNNILSKEIDERDQEIKHLNEFYENKINTLIRESEEINNKFELRLNQDEFEHNKEKERLKKIIDEGEKEINDFLIKKRQDEIYYNRVIDELKNEIDCHKKMISNDKEMIRKDISLIKEENERLIKNLDWLKKEIELKNDHIDYLQSNMNTMKTELETLTTNNKFLIRENEGLNYDIGNCKSEYSRKIQNMENFKNDNFKLSKDQEILKLEIERLNRMLLR